MRSIWALVGAGLVFAASAWSADAYRGEPIAAVWKEQQLRFFYLGRTSRYSCDGLRDKVRAMLLELGARRDLRIEALGCEGSAAQSRLGAPGPSLNIVFSALALPDTKLKPFNPGDL